jgi:hypothetical protein
MLAWIELCHRSTPAHSSLQKRAKIPVLADETTSEMIKVMANIRRAVGSRRRFALDIP